MAKPLWSAFLPVLVPLALLAGWPQFRGPTGQGHADVEGLPLHWSESRNVTWKVALPGEGWSSPSILKGRLWLTAAVDDGRSLRALALDAESGQLLDDIEVFQHESPIKIHRKNSYASPSPVLEGDRVYVHFGSLGTAALNASGDILWRNNDLRCAHVHGPGASPVLAGDLLIITCDGGDRQFIAGIDKDTGHPRWRTPRPEGNIAFATPLVIQTEEKQLLISPGANRATAYEAETGKEVWWFRYRGFSNVPRPVFGHGLVYITSGFYNPVLYAVRVGGRGDVSNTHIVWKAERGIPLTPSPILVGDELYIVSDNGIATCFDAKTGTEHWRERLGGSFSASPLYADDRIYFLNEDGETTVLEPGPEFKVLAKNQIDGRTLASMGVADQALFLRSDTSLYRIENRAD